MSGCLLHGGHRLQWCVVRGSESPSVSQQDVNVVGCATLRLRPLQCLLRGGRLLRQWRKLRGAGMRRIWRAWFNMLGFLCCDRGWSNATRSRLLSRVAFGLIGRCLGLVAMRLDFETSCLGQRLPCRNDSKGLTSGLRCGGELRTSGRLPSSCCCCCCCCLCLERRWLSTCILRLILKAGLVGGGLCGC